MVVDRTPRNRLTLHDAQNIIEGQSIIVGTREHEVREMRNLLREMVAWGFIVVADTSNRGRLYQLSEGYRKFVGMLSEDASRSDTTKEPNT